MVLGFGEGEEVGRGEADAELHGDDLGVLSLDLEDDHRS